VRVVPTTLTVTRRQTSTIIVFVGRLSGGGKFPVTCNREGWRHRPSATRWSITEHERPTDVITPFHFTYIRRRIYARASLMHVASSGRQFSRLLSFQILINCYNSWHSIQRMHACMENINKQKSFNNSCKTVLPKTSSRFRFHKYSNKFEVK